jgi:hypothetical protein
MVHRILTFIIVVWFLSLNKKGSFTEWAFLRVLCKNAVPVATGYRVDGPGIEFRCRQDSSHPSRPALWPNQPPVSLYSWG